MTFKVGDRVTSNQPGTTVGTVVSVLGEQVLVGSYDVAADREYTWVWAGYLTLCGKDVDCNSTLTSATREKSSGGPSSYYDMPFQDWVTTNDMMEYLAEHKWGRFGIHLKDIFKGLCRWGDKSGTDTLYDTKKIIYYGCRVLAMLSGKEALRGYLQELLNDKQFRGSDKC